MWGKKGWTPRLRPPFLAATMTARNAKSLLPTLLLGVLSIPGARSWACPAATSVSEGRRPSLALCGATAPADGGSRERRAVLLDGARLLSSAAALFPEQRLASADAPPGAVMVTGANSGVGQAVAEQLAGKGYSVVMGCRQPSSAAIAASAIRSLHPDAMIYCPVLPLDLSDLSQVAPFAKEIRASVPLLRYLKLIHWMTCECFWVTASAAHLRLCLCVCTAGWCCALASTARQRPEPHKATSFT